MRFDPLDLDDGDDDNDNDGDDTNDDGDDNGDDASDEGHDGRSYSLIQSRLRMSSWAGGEL